MKPKRPSEKDLLSVIQDGFNAQLPKDRGSQPLSDATLPRVDTPPALPMVRITLSVPEELRYRLKTTLMSRQRNTRHRITQDAYCAQAISTQLDLDDGGPDPREQLAQYVSLLRDGLREGAFAEGLAARARRLLERTGQGEA